MADRVGEAIRAGLLARCPNCGKGKLFEGYLRLAPQTEQRGADFTMADTGDGAAVFVMFLVGAIVVPLAFILQFSVHASTWVTLSVSLVAATALSLGFLRPFKATLFTLQWTHKAEEGKLQR